MSKKETVLSVIHSKAKNGYRLGILGENYRNSTATRVMVETGNGVSFTINAMDTYKIYGAIASREISQWLVRMGYVRDSSKQPMHLMKFYFEQKEDTDVYTFVSTSPVMKEYNKKALTKEGKSYPYHHPDELVRMVWE